jgi:hypothetical protein
MRLIEMGIGRKDHSSLVAVLRIEKLPPDQSQRWPSMKSARQTHPSTSSPDCNRQTKAKNRAFPRESLTSVPTKQRCIGKLLHEIGTKVRVLLKNIRRGDGEFLWSSRRSSKLACPVLQVFTLHGEGISRVRIAVNNGLHLIR